jgi:hypothetical protein
MKPSVDGLSKTSQRAVRPKCISEYLSFNIRSDRSIQRYIHRKEEDWLCSGASLVVTFRSLGKGHLGT